MHVPRLLALGWLLTSLAHAAPQLVDLGPAFHQWRVEAEGRSETEQLQLWTRLVESPHQQFYDAVVWEKASRPNYATFRSAQLQAAFRRYRGHEAEIEQQFRDFPAQIQRAQTAFQRHFPDADPDVPIWAVPSAFTYNGQGAAYPLNPPRTVLTFGLDQVALSGENLDVLFAHELFHIYHARAMQIEGSEATAASNPLLFLWMEGLATYVSQQLTPDATLADVLMDRELAQVSATPWLAAEFLHTQENTHSFRNRWFRAGTGHLLRPDLPPRCAYLLGLAVCQHLALTNNLHDMAHWSPEKACQQVEAALQTLAAHP